ncbi:MAG TPA: hypothetical protein VNI01_05210 [Elusimicrobiota bacterium]|nr:hypothetical protein [Elusimicrobiota bacterium]
MEALGLATVIFLVLVVAAASARRARGGCGCGPSCACDRGEGCGCGLFCPCGRGGRAPGSAPQDPVRLRLRALWREHVSRTLAFVVSSAGGLADAKAVSDHLLDNQKDIGALFSERFGPATGGAATALLTDHILIAAELVAALKGGQPTDAISGRWDKNADDLAAALQRLRPAWGAAREMLREHLRGTAAYVQAYLRGDYAKALQLVDDAQAHMARFADLLAEKWD